MGLVSNVRMVVRNVWIKLPLFVQNAHTFFMGKSPKIMVNALLVPHNVWSAIPLILQNASNAMITTIIRHQEPAWLVVNSAEYAVHRVVCNVFMDTVL